MLHEMECWYKQELREGFQLLDWSYCRPICHNALKAFEQKIINLCFGQRDSTVYSDHLPKCYVSCPHSQKSAYLVIISMFSKVNAQIRLIEKNNFKMTAFPRR